jgi:hypothetical protein
MHPRTAILAALSILLAAPAVAWSQIYTWIDEYGSTVYSNVRPDGADQVKDFKRVIEAEKPVPPAVAAQRAAQAAQDDAIRKEQALQQRIANLEQRLQALQFPGYPGAAVQPPSYAYYEAADPGFGFPYYGFFPAAAAAFVVPSHSRLAPRSLIISSRNVVNSGPVFATPGVPPFARSAPGMFASRIAAPQVHRAIP